MRQISAPLLIVLLVIGTAAAQPPENKLRLKLPGGNAAEATEEAPAPVGDDEVANRASYSIGAEMGRNFRKMEAPVNLAMLIKGLQDAFTGKKLTYTDEEMGDAIGKFEQTVGTKYQAKVANENKAEGEKFLAENSKKEGVVTLPSGLQYKIIKSGDGKTPGKADAVTTHYHGTFIDGTVFDSSVANGQPATFPVSRVIKGWTEALQLMKEGDKWQLFIPSSLAYGAQGFSGRIGPNQTLIFELELLKVGATDGFPPK